MGYNTWFFVIIIQLFPEIIFCGIKIEESSGDFVSF